MVSSSSCGDRTNADPGAGNPSRSDRRRSVPTPIPPRSAGERTGCGAASRSSRPVGTYRFLCYLLLPACCSTPWYSVVT